MQVMSKSAKEKSHLNQGFVIRTTDKRLWRRTRFSMIRYDHLGEIFNPQQAFVYDGGHISGKKIAVSGTIRPTRYRRRALQADQA